MGRTVFTPSEDDGLMCLQLKAFTWEESHPGGYIFLLKRSLEEGAEGGSAFEDLIERH